VEPDRPHMTIWRMRITCWITKAKNTHSEFVLLIALPLQQWLYKRSSMLRYGGYTLVTLPRIVTLYRDSVDGTRDRVTYQKFVTR
jgi:hypothetical protein